MLKKLMRKLGYSSLPLILAQSSAIMLSFPVLRDTFLHVKNSSNTPKNLRKYMDWSTRRAAIMRPKIKEVLKTGKALIVYHSNTGNTEKVAFAIAKGLRKAGLEPNLKKASEALDEDYYKYDLVCIGTPCLHALPPPQIMKLVKKKFAGYRKTPSEVRVPSVTIPGKYALVFVTFSGPHVGVNEAYPAGKLLVQEFQHLGFDVKGEWYLVGEFHGWKEGSTIGKLGDIRGRPNEKDVALIEEKAVQLVNSINQSSDGNDVWVRQ
ncbi:MAG: hypothetical protein CW691_10340 [Candidatus Bathyarchaeum sp.]|nr:MAG: hypothetical protein CW691_10340 [Candidatus Bathyarchaeum sp.]